MCQRHSNTVRLLDCKALLSHKLINPSNYQLQFGWENIIRSREEKTTKKTTTRVTTTTQMWFRDIAAEEKINKRQRRKLNSVHRHAHVIGSARGEVWLRTNQRHWCWARAADASSSEADTSTKVTFICSLCSFFFCYCQTSIYLNDGQFRRWKVFLPVNLFTL